MIQNGDIFYMGTDGHPGHHLVGLTKYIASYSLDERDKLSKFLDGGFKRINGLLEKEFDNSCYKYGCAYVEGYGTLYGILLSPDDERYGSETLAFVWGEKKTKTEMIDIILETPFLKNRFLAVATKYKLQTPWSLPTIDYTIDDAIKELSTNSNKGEHKYSEARAKCMLICKWLEDYKNLKNK